MVTVYVCSFKRLCINCIQSQPWHRLDYWAMLPHEHWIGLYCIVIWWTGSRIDRRTRFLGERKEYPFIPPGIMICNGFYPHASLLWWVCGCSLRKVHSGLSCPTKVPEVAYVGITAVKLNHASRASLYANFPYRMDLDILHACSKIHTDHPKTIPAFELSYSWQVKARG